MINSIGFKGINFKGWIDTTTEKKTTEKQDLKLLKKISQLSFDDFLTVNHPKKDTKEFILKNFDKIEMNEKHSGTIISYISHPNVATTKKHTIKSSNISGKNHHIFDNTETSLNMVRELL